MFPTRKAIAGLAIVASTGFVSAQTVLLDIGSADNFRGLDVSNPDVDGNTWTSVWQGDFYTNLLDITGTPTTIDFGFDGGPQGADSFNGPAGPTDSSSLAFDLLFTDIDSEALGLLGGALEGAFDYIVGSPENPGRFQIQQLDPTRSYQFTFFGSHKFNNDDVTRYNVYSDPGYTNLIGTADLEVGVGPDHNRDMVATISGLTPTSENDILFVEWVGANGGFGYLNAMQIVTGPPSVVEGDFNGDGAVDNGDLNLLLGSWGDETVPAEWVNGFASPVDNDELNALLGNWGAGIGGVAVPEPSAALLCVLLAAPFARRRG